MPVAEAIHNRVRSVRAERQLSQERLSVLASVNLKTIGMIERADYIPPPPARERIARALHTELPELWPGVYAAS